MSSDARTGFNEDGYAIYRDYANKQAAEVLKEKHDWSIFEHECADLGRVLSVSTTHLLVGLTLNYTGSL